jgi:hypothetical protein
MSMTLKDIALPLFSRELSGFSRDHAVRGCRGELTIKIKQLEPRGGLFIV